MPFNIASTSRLLISSTFNIINACTKVVKGAMGKFVNTIFYKNYEYIYLNTYVNNTITY